ncbi:C40 family peptidase [Massilia sp. W12]|uniref:C40 family peptidase n=2 Tax=Massilia sp. W12 TaxID=3126507 RepID=UPI0030D4F944
MTRLTTRESLSAKTGVLSKKSRYGLCALLVAVSLQSMAIENDPLGAALASMQASAAPSTSPAAATPPATDAKPLGKLQDITSRASELVMQAMGMLGVNYRRGGNVPESGFDCSGLVRHVFKEAWGNTLPRTAEEISRVGKQIMPQDLQPGDLVFYNTMRKGFSHVGIYLGDNKFIHSPSSGGQVRIESMDLSYWKQRFNGARRIEDQKAAAALSNMAGNAAAASSASASAR